MSSALLHITLSTHNFAVTRLTPRAREVVFGFTKQFVQYGLVRIPGGRFVNAAVKVYGAATASREEFRFHINQYNQFKEHLARNSITDDLIEAYSKPVPEGLDINIVMKDLRPPRGEQPEAISYLEQPNEFRTKFLPIQTGLGKAQPLDAKIKIPGGWSTMDQMQIGTKIIAKDGTITQVTGVYPQGEIDVYKVTFVDGRSTEVCGEHLWKIYKDISHSRGSVVQTFDMMNLLNSGKSVSIDLVEPDVDSNKDVYKAYLKGDFLNIMKFDNLIDAQKYQYDVRSLGGIACLIQEDEKYRVDYQFHGLISYSLRLSLSSIEFIGKKIAQCISIDHPDKLYITNDFIVTHNTFISLKAMKTIGKRVVLIVKPMYIDKWIKDFYNAYDIELTDIMAVKGSSHLQALITMAKDETLEANFIIISNKTMQNWIKTYELHDQGSLDMGYDCLPEDFYEVLGAGVRLIDEVHQDFHLNFKLDLYTNIEQTIALSATLLNNDPFLEKMYRVAFPTACRFVTGPLDKYITSRALLYSLDRNTVVRTSEFGSTSYSHIAFEKSILRNHIVRDSYFKLINYVIGFSFTKDYKPGEKCAVFCSSIETCTQLVRYLQTKHPTLDIRRYVAEDPIENLHDSDIRVTTILSGGTAHDISNLKAVVLTISVDSLQANIQTLGRLRKIPGMNVQFVYMSCNDIPKQIDYHLRKQKMLNERAASFQIVNAPFLV